MSEDEVKPKEFEDEVIARTLKAFRDATPFAPLFELALHEARNNAYARGLQDGFALSQNHIDQIQRLADKARSDGREDAIRWLRLHSHNVCSGPEFADAFQVVLSLRHMRNEPEAPT